MGFCQCVCMVTVLVGLLAGCKTFHDRLGQNYPTYFATSPASAAYKPGRTYRNSRIQILEPATRRGLQRVAFGAPCRPRVAADENAAFSYTFTEEFRARATGELEIAGLASLRSDPELAKVVREVTMTVIAKHLVIGAKEIAAAQQIASRACRSYLRDGKMITQAIVADVTIDIDFEAGVNASASVARAAARKITGSVGFGISATSRSTATATGVIIADKFENADETP